MKNNSMIKFEFMSYLDGAKRLERTILDGPISEREEKAAICEALVSDFRKRFSVIPRACGEGNRLLPDGSGRLLGSGVQLAAQWTLCTP